MGIRCIAFIALLLGIEVLKSGAAAQSLTELQYTVTGQQLQVSPASLSVPKGIPGSFLATPLAGGKENSPDGTYIEATLRGPSFPARRIVGQAGTPILLPPLNLVGDYSLDNIRLVDSETNETILTGSPSSIPIRVFDEVLDHDRPPGHVFVGPHTAHGRRPQSAVEKRLRGIYGSIRTGSHQPIAQRAGRFLRKVDLDDIASFAARNRVGLYEGPSGGALLEHVRTHRQVRRVGGQALDEFVRDFLGDETVPAVLRDRSPGSSNLARAHPAEPSKRVRDTVEHSLPQVLEIFRRKRGLTTVRAPEKEQVHHVAVLEKPERKIGERLGPHVGAQVVAGPQVPRVCEQDGIVGPHEKISRVRITMSDAGVLKLCPQGPDVPRDLVTTLPTEKRLG